MKSMAGVDVFRTAWRQAGCVMVSLPTGGGVVVASKKGMMFEVNTDGYVLLDLISAENFNYIELFDREAAIVFLDEVAKVIQ